MQINPVTIAGRTHLFPSRTQKLSSLAPMILGGKLPGKVGRCRFFIAKAIKKPLKKLKKTCRKPVDKVRKEWYY